MAGVAGETRPGPEARSPGKRRAAGIYGAIITAAILATAGSELHGPLGAAARHTLIFTTSIAAALGLVMVALRDPGPASPALINPGTGVRRGAFETVTRIGGTVERAEKTQIERVINHELKERFAAGAVQRAVLLEHGDDPAIEPGQLMVRVFVPAPEEPADYEQALADWQEAHRAGMDEMRRELSLRLPSARLLEFTFDDPGDATPRITMPDDGSLAAEQMSGREIVTTALALLRANYVFPEVAEQAAAAVEARLAAGEYDDLDEITLTELVTRPPAGRHRGQAPAAAARRRSRRPGRRGPRPAEPERSPRTTRPGGWPCGSGGGWTTSASAGWSGWTATSATSTCAGSRAGQRGPGHRRGHGTGRRDLRAHPRPAA